MTSYLAIKYLHLVLFAYWLGGDLGTFLASRQVANTKLSPESRRTALRIMLACDMGPKLAMPLVLPTGLHMAASGSMLAIPAAALAPVWVICLCWFAWVLTIYLKEGGALAGRLTRFDLYFRIALIALLLAWIAILVATAPPPLWIVSKLLVFALLVTCGIGIRFNLKSFKPAFAQMMSDGASAQSDAAMRISLQRCLPWVWCIWAGLFTAAALGARLLG